MVSTHSMIHTRAGKLGSAGIYLHIIYSRSKKNMAEEENLMFKTQSLLREVVSHLEKTESSPQGVEPCESDALDRQLPPSHVEAPKMSASMEFR